MRTPSGLGGLFLLAAPVSAFTLILPLVAGCSSSGDGRTSTTSAQETASGGIHRGPLVQVSSTASSFTSACEGPTGPGGVNFPNTNLEPSIAVNPWNPYHLVAAWQQNRWSDSGSAGIVTAYSTDGGRSWTPGGQLAFTTCTGGRFQRAAHARVQFTANGDVLISAMGIDEDGDGADGTLGATGMMVTRSMDGGKTFAPSTVLIDSPGDTVDASGLGLYNDFENLTTDPTNRHNAYVVWTQYNTLSSMTCPEQDYFGPIYFSRTENADSCGGQPAWSAPTKIFDPGLDAYAPANQIVVTGAGRIADMFVYAQDWATASAPPSCGGSSANPMQLALVSSTDNGTTWSSTPTIVDNMSPPGGISVTMADGSSVAINDAAFVPAVAANAHTHSICAAWQDTRFSPAGPPPNASDIAFTMSTDGGRTWATTIKVNPPASVSAFLPSLAVSDTGRVAIRYYDLRNNTTPSASITTSEWVTTCDHGCTVASNWKELQNRPDFDLSTAPNAVSGSISGLLLGNFESIIAFGNNIVTASTETNGTPNMDEVFVRNTLAGE